MIVRLRGSDYPLVTGLVVAIGGRRQVFVPMDKVSLFDGDVLKLTTAKLDLRHFERRDGEVLLNADVPRHRLAPVTAEPPPIGAGRFPRPTPLPPAERVS